MASLPTSPTSTTAAGSSSAFTHLLALVAGIIIGKSIDADELNAYRSSSSYADDLWTRIRRQMKSMIVGGVVLGLLVKTASEAMGSLLGGGESSSDDDKSADVGSGGGAITTSTTSGSRWR
ncbi:hypothetical protein ACHAWU_004922 [Discostella pseudostelligera]|uniref:Uncharacterized protein n=1 Tax=Discostella pseudostelligera TaxID=259834 RepID=A0ABD3MK03_9STRA